MKKTLYSLMLSDDVIREIDMLAHRMGTNRSNLVNQILADHVKMQTPEKRVSDIFSVMEELLSSSRELVPMVTQGSPSMAMRSCLEYKYRPTLRYEVALFPSLREGAFGEMSVIFRTTSTALLGTLTEFFRLWKSVEDSLLDYRRGYLLEDGRFTRTLVYPTGGELSPNALAEVISDYVSVFDRQLKRYVAGDLDPESLMQSYMKEIRVAI